MSTLRASAAEFRPVPRVADPEEVDRVDVDDVTAVHHAEDDITDVHHTEDSGSECDDESEDGMAAFDDLVRTEQDDIDAAYEEDDSVRVEYNMIVHLGVEEAAQFGIDVDTVMATIASREAAAAPRAAAPRRSCHYGADCTRPGCWFEHPPRAAAAAAPHVATAAAPQRSCHYGADCTRAGCRFEHPSRAAVAAAAVPVVRGHNPGCHGRHFGACTYPRH